MRKIPTRPRSFVPGLMLALLMLSLQAVAACGANDEGRQRLDIVNRKGEVARLRVEIAGTPEELARGLSSRASLGRDEGMLFVIARRGPGFWMKDTSIPLSVAFISACGEIVAIFHMEPFSLEIHNTAREYGFGLEVNRGWFESHGIAVGDRVRLPVALKPTVC